MEVSAFLWMSKPQIVHFCPTKKDPLFKIVQQGIRVTVEEFLSYTVSKLSLSRLFCSQNVILGAVTCLNHFNE